MANPTNETRRGENSSRVDMHVGQLPLIEWPATDRTLAFAFTRQVAILIIELTLCEEVLKRTERSTADIGLHATELRTSFHFAHPVFAIYLLKTNVVLLFTKSLTP